MGSQKSRLKNVGHSFENNHLSSSNKNSSFIGKQFVSCNLNCLSQTPISWTFLKHTSYISNYSALIILLCVQNFIDLILFWCSLLILTIIFGVNSSKQCFCYRNSPHVFGLSMGWLISAETFVNTLAPFHFENSFCGPKCLSNDGCYVPVLVFFFLQILLRGLLFIWVTSVKLQLYLDMKIKTSTVCGLYPHFFFFCV